MLTNPNFEVPEEAWRQGATGVPVSDAFTNADGAWRLVITGIWSTGKRAYDHNSAEVAGYVLSEAERLGVAIRLVNAGPVDVDHYREDADAGWDDEFRGLHRITGKTSTLVVWAVPADAPIYLRYATMYRSSAGVPHGTKQSWIGPDDIETAPQYRRAARAYREVHDLPAPLPREAAPPTERQLAVLRRALTARGGWGYSAAPELPRSAQGASTIIDALAQADWKPTGAVRQIWEAAIRDEVQRGLWPRRAKAEAEEEIEIP